MREIEQTMTAEQREIFWDLMRAPASGDCFLQEMKANSQAYWSSHCTGKGSPLLRSHMSVASELLLRISVRSCRTTRKPRREKVSGEVKA